MPPPCANYTIQNATNTSKCFISVPGAQPCPDKPCKITSCTEITDSSGCNTPIKNCSYTDITCPFDSCYDLVCINGGCQRQRCKTEVPNCCPTLSPTSSPTSSPTGAPTNAPTKAPTRAPTSEPTDAPTESPTESPTRSPTAPTSPPPNPTEQPTEQPTNAPTEKPTKSPTRSPTEEPTDAPTSMPTIAPTGVPTEQPTSICNLPCNTEHGECCLSNQSTEMCCCKDNYTGVLCGIPPGQNECNVDNECVSANQCSTGKCINFTCVFTSINCDDNNACTLDRCDPIDGCIHVDQVCIICIIIIYTHISHFISIHLYHIIISHIVYCKIIVTFGRL